jgi:hypothetical protein
VRRSTLAYNAEFRRAVPARSAIRPDAMLVRNRTALVTGAATESCEAIARLFAA